MYLKSPIAFTYLAFLSWFYFVLSILVIKNRMKHRISLGSQNRELEKFVRVHGNFSEYVIFGIVLLFACEQLGANTVYLHTLGLSLIVGRICHYIGVIHLQAPNPMRIAGMMLTFYVLITAPAVIIYCQ
jgi:uncharacterized membrane protein YecN with MAPEG domain